MNIVIKPLGAVVLGFIAAVLALVFVVLVFFAVKGLTPGAAAAKKPNPPAVTSTNPSPAPSPGETNTSSLPVVEPGTSGVTASGIMPEAGAAASAVAASPVIHGHAIYRDGLENGWATKGWAWVKDYNLDDHSIVHSGKSAIRVKYSGFDGLKFHYEKGALDTTPFNRISMYVYGGKIGGQLIQLGASLGEKQNTTQGLMFGPLPANKWVAITVPLNKIGLDNKPNFTSFWIQGGKDKPQPDLYVDEVRLLKPEEPSPSGPALTGSPITTKAS